MLENINSWKNNDVFYVIVSVINQELDIKNEKWFEMGNYPKET